jgi:hypothetical protein
MHFFELTRTEARALSALLLFGALALAAWSWL